MNRRRFLQGIGLGLTASAAAGGGCASACAREGPKAAPRKSGGPSRVAVFRDDGVRGAQGFLQQRVGELLDRAVGAALDAPDAVSGWRSIFSGGDVVGVKLNCLAGQPLSPSRELVHALVESLTKASVNPDQIIFFERGERDIDKGGFEVRQSGSGPKFMGNDSPEAGYESDPEISGEVGSCLSRIVTRRISGMISLGVLKDHNLAGVGAGMKNLFGIIHNPNKYHDNGCNPYVAQVLAYPVVQRKLQLVILDALTAQCHGGPGYLPGFAWPFNGVVVSRDPVALDRVAWELIDRQRQAKGLRSLSEDRRAPKWLRTAAELDLGVDDLGKIKVVQQA